MKKVPCVPQLTYTREESQMPISRSSTNLIRKWNPTSAPEQRCQISEELGRRIGMMESSLNRFKMILDSAYSDVTQVNRGTKELMLEGEGISQKLIAFDASLQQLMNKGHADFKASLDGGLKSLSDQLGKGAYEEKFKEILMVLRTLPLQTEASLLKLENKLSNLSAERMQAVACNSLKRPNQNCELTNTLPTKAMVQAWRILIKKVKWPLFLLISPIVPPEVSVQAIQVPKVDMGGWKSVKKEQPMKEVVSNKDHGKKEVSSTLQAKESRIIIDSDEETDRGFSCLISETGTGNLIPPTEKENERCLFRRWSFSNLILQVRDYSSSPP